LLWHQLQIGATAICGAIPVCAPFAPLVAGLTSAFVTGVTSGKLGLALRAGFISGFTAVAFFGVGEMTSSFGVEGGVLNPALGGHGPLDFMSDAHLFNIAGHALVGCLSAVASGGKCGGGAAAGGLASLGSPLVEQYFPNARIDAGEKLGGTIASAVLGGIGSVAGGGKFANGAVTGAFGYLFNQLGAAERRGMGASVDISNGTLSAPPGLQIWQWQVSPLTNNLYPVIEDPLNPPPGVQQIDVTGWTATYGPPGSTYTEATFSGTPPTPGQYFPYGVIFFTRPGGIFGPVPLNENNN
jgi:hypothetical protein